MALYEAKEKVFQLENAIQKLDSIKKHLSQNIKDIKGEIHSCVSHNLEFLRGREVTLLNKVDEVVKQKEESLQQQQAQLNQALGVLRTRMALMKNNDSDLDKKIAETLTQFNQMELSPGETPHIAFRADHMTLRECIQNYGRVDANALPLPSAFDDSKKPSVSLPRHIEEYEDVDHIFYKTVEEINSNPATKSINVVIPKLSTRIEDWLQKRVVPQDEGFRASTTVSSLAQSGQHGLNTPNKSCCSTSGDTNSLNNWLSQIKHHADLEEEHDFEIVDNSCKNKASTTCIDGMPEDLKSWLSNAPGYQEGLSPVQVPSDNLFKHIPLESKHWLHQACQQISSLEGNSETNFFQHISKEPSTWLRSRAYGKQVSQFAKDGKAGHGKDAHFVLKDETVNQWLAQKGQTKQVKSENQNNNCCNQDCWLQEEISAPNKADSSKTLPIPFQLEDICKANELCSNLMECVSKPNCAVLCQQERSGVKNPLDPTKVFSPLQLPQSEWLLPTCDSNSCCEKMDVCDKEMTYGEKDCVEDGLKKDMFSHIADLSCDQWLIKPPSRQTETGTPSTLPVFKQTKEEANIWLRQSQENTPSEQEMETKMISYSPPCKSLSDWLFSPATKAEIIDKDEELFMKEESEGWSICSTPTSFNSEQFCKDVKVATSYLQNWVL